MKQIVLDFETRSDCDLKKSGGVKYAQDPSTEIICAAYKIGENETKLWKAIDGEPLPQELIKVAFDGRFIWVAHNALFEQSIVEFVLRRKFPVFPSLPPERWKCTAAKAAACGLPRSLEGAGTALNLPIKKNMDGRKLMLKHSKPRPTWKKWREQNPNLSGWEYGEPEKYFEDELERWAIQKYCVTDVETEYLLDKTLPDLIDIEKEIWLLNQKMNLRGVKVDVETANTVLDLIDFQSRTLVKELIEITNGEVETPNQRERLLIWIQKQGVNIPDLAAATVEATLKALPEMGFAGTPAERVLEIRQALAKSSTKKYQALVDRAGDDERVRDLALYHGAHTGRESGTGLQIHNLPKGKIKDTDQAIEILKTEDPEFIEAIYGDPMSVYSACVRGMITASPDHSLFVADYSAIEARVLAWVANDLDALNVFENNGDPYIKMAAAIFGIPENEVTPEQRQIGKIAELGLGYGMGANKFHQTCHAWGVKTVDEEMAERAVKAYRSLHKPIVRLWKNVETAAIRAVQNSRIAIKMNRVKFGMRARFLWVELPSGRRIQYYGPTCKVSTTSWGTERPTLYHWGSNSLTKKWECHSTYGALIVENIVQGIARDINLQSALRLEANGYQYLFQVHDELVSESKRGNVESFEKILTDLPAWAQGLPITAKGWNGPRYKK